MMQLVVRKQNGCQKCVAQLDTKANERKGSPRFRNGRHNLLAHHWGDISLGSVRATLQLESEVRNRVAVLQDFGLPGLNGLAQAPLDPLIEGLGRSSLPGQVSLYDVKHPFKALLASPGFNSLSECLTMT